MSTLVAEATSGKIRMLAGRAKRVQAYAASATELRAWRVLGPASRTVHRQDHTLVLDEIGKAARKGVAARGVKKSAPVTPRVERQCFSGQRAEKDTGTVHAIEPDA